ncbi:MAG: putative transferase [Ornithinibacter sp.]|nr:putative transferase [Ornithinibacter sp.]
MGATVISDDVVLLRPLSPEDTEAHLSGCDQAIVDSLGGGEPPTEAQVRHWLTGAASAWARQEPSVDLGIQDKATAALCGTAGTQRAGDYLQPGQVNLTYSLYPDWRGRGHATRAVRLLMELAHRGGGVDEFVIRVAAWNGSSIRVAERLGFRFSHTSDDEHGRLEWFVAPDL